MEDNEECEDQESENSEDSILIQLEKNKNALDKVSEAYNIALDRFLNA